MIDEFAHHVVVVIAQEVITAVRGRGVRQGGRLVLQHIIQYHLPHETSLRVRTLFLTLKRSTFRVSCFKKCIVTKHLEYKMFVEPYSLSI